MPLRAGSPATQIALEELEHVYAYLYRRVGNRADAEDLTQEVALQALPRLHGTASAISVRGYLFAAARSRLAQFWARRFVLPEETLRDDLQEPDAPDESRHAEAMRRATWVLDQLPDRYARVLELRFLYGYSAAEIARELGTSTGAVRITQLRALRWAARMCRDG